MSQRQGRGLRAFRLRHKRSPVRQFISSPQRSKVLRVSPREAINRKFRPGRSRSSREKAEATRAQGRVGRARRSGNSARGAWAGPPGPECIKESTRNAQARAGSAGEAVRTCEGSGAGRTREECRRTPSDAEQTGRRLRRYKATVYLTRTKHFGMNSIPTQRSR